MKEKPTTPPPAPAQDEGNYGGTHPDVSGYHHRTRYGFGNEVYHRLRGEDARGLVTAILIRPGGSTTYGVTWANRAESYHQELELTGEPPAPGV